MLEGAVRLRLRLHAQSQTCTPDNPPAKDGLKIRGTQAPGANRDRAAWRAKVRPLDQQQGNARSVLLGTWNGRRESGRGRGSEGDDEESDAREARRRACARHDRAGLSTQVRRREKRGDGPERGPGTSCRPKFQGLREAKISSQVVLSTFAGDPAASPPRLRTRTLRSVCCLSERDREEACSPP